MGLDGGETMAKSCLYLDAEEATFPLRFHSIVTTIKHVDFEVNFSTESLGFFHPISGIVSEAKIEVALLGKNFLLFFDRQKSCSSQREWMQNSCIKGSSNLGFIVF